MLGVGSNPHSQVQKPLSWALNDEKQPGKCIQAVGMASADCKCKGPEAVMDAQRPMRLEQRAKG